MAYSTDNPPRCRSDSFAGPGNAWYYTSADAAAVVDTTGYITNGGKLGMKVGDLVQVYNTVGLVHSMHRVVSVSATEPGAVDLGDGTTVGSATNTD